MPSQVLTDKAVRNAMPSPGERLELWDTVVSDDSSLSGSFGLRVTDKGVKSWVVMYRAEDRGKARLRRFTLGHYPAYSLAQARGMAREALGKVGREIDPAEEKRALKAVKRADKTVEEAVADFIQRYAKRKNRSWQETERIFEREVLSVWRGRLIKDIGRADVIELLDGVMDRGAPYMANRVLACVRKLFNWCLERGTVPASPVANIKAPGKEVKRDRVLDNDEIKAVWQACDTMGWPFGLLFKFLLVTGQRRDEAATMKWEHLDIDQALWTLPREATKSDRLNEVPLSPLAVEILESVPRMGDYVFSTNGRTHVSGFSKSKARCDQVAEVYDWRLHDLRRTAATGMARLNIAPHVVEKVLNHDSGAISGVAAIYNRHGYQSEKREALEAWGQVLTELISQ